MLAIASLRASFPIKYMLIALCERKPDLIRVPDVEVIFGESWRRRENFEKLATNRK